MTVGEAQEYFALLGHEKCADADKQLVIDDDGYVRGNYGTTAERLAEYRTDTEKFGKRFIFHAERRFRGEGDK